MRGPTSSLTARVSVASLASAALAAAIAAIVACAFADALLTSTMDRTLDAAAAEIVRELALPGHPPIEDVIRDEEDEGASAGMRFTVVSAKGEPLGGDLHVGGKAPGCGTDRSFRACTTIAADGTRVTAAARSESRLGLFAIAALAAAALAALVAWALGTVLARRALAPLERLQDRIAALRLDAAPIEDASRTGTPALGQAEGIREVDELRKAVALLHRRMNDALAHSGRFAANAAHELRTPLTTVRAELELLAEAEVELATREHEEDGAPSAHPGVGLRRALKKVQQLQDLTERLLLLALPEMQDEARELVSLRDVIEDTVLDLAESERARVTIVAGDEILVRGDGAALGIVVSNGLSNALKFGSQVAIEVTTDGAEAVLAIEDDGPGVSEEERAKVFEPFVRGARTLRAPGHGLGLTLVAHVAKRHAGRAAIVPSTRFETGTRLEVRLPVAHG